MMQSETILVVDDEASSRECCSTVLASEGYRVRRGGGGADALKICDNEGPIDLVLVDVVMQGMNGIELAKQIEILEGAPRIALISGYSPDEVERLIGTDGSRYRIFWKPFEIGIFLQMIRNVLDAPQREAAFSAGS